MNNNKQTLQNLVDTGRFLKDENNYRVHNREKEWEEHARFYSDDDLLKLKKAMLLVFCEESPEFEIPKEQRLFSVFADKKTFYSKELRESLAITLALIGNKPDLLVNCSSNLRETFASAVIRDVFNEMTWQRLATLDAALPFFAEAAPDTFLEELSTLADNKELFANMLADEGDLFQGSFHWLGIVHALETLAWEENYLMRTVILLAKFALLDNPQSNIHPRPQDILKGIFWPCLPQSIASTEKLLAGAQNLLKINHQLGWDVLTRAIDATTGTPHLTPRIRKTLPAGFTDNRKVDQKQYSALIKGYENLLLKTAEEDLTLINQLAQHLERFKRRDSFSQALKELSSQNNADDEFKEPIWTELRRQCARLRRYANKDQTISKEKISDIERVIPLLEPESTFFKNKYLFDNNLLDWRDSNNYESEERKLQDMQLKAVKEIFYQYPLDEILRLLKYIKNSVSLGMAVSRADIPFEQDLISSLLEMTDDKTKGFIEGYLWQSYCTNKEMLLTAFENANWNDMQKVRFLCCLPFKLPVLHFCEKWLGNRENLYWDAYRSGITTTCDDDNSFAIQKALKYNRADIAIECLYWDYQRKKSIDFDTCAQALFAFTESAEMENIQHWQITDLISDLQKKARTPEQNNKLIQIEFLYLSLLDSDVHKDISPVTLDTALASEPEFFHQVLTMVYKAKNQPDRESTPITESAARNAFRLLHQWKKMPGFVNENWDYNIFKNWYDKVLGLSEKSNHLAIAKSHIGSILFYAPEDSSGLWIDKRIAALFEEKGNEELHEGFWSEALNSRGVHIVDFSGKEDLDIAQEYRQKASDLEDEGFFDFAKTLRKIAESFEDDAKRNKREGERRTRPEEL